MPQFWSHTGSLHHTAVLSDITKEYSHTAILSVCMFYVADTAILSVCIELIPVCLLRTHDIREFSARSTSVDIAYFFCHHSHRVVGPFSVSTQCEACDRVFLYILSKSRTIYALAREVEQVTLCQFTQYAEYAACPILLLDRIFLPVRSQLAEERNLSAQSIDITHLEINLCLLCNSQQVEHSIC